MTKNPFINFVKMKKIKEYINENELRITNEAKLILSKQLNEMVKKRVDKIIKYFRIKEGRKKKTINIEHIKKSPLDPEMYDL